MPLRHIFQDNHPVSYLSTTKKLLIDTSCWENGVGCGGLVTRRAATLPVQPPVQPPNLLLLARALKMMSCMGQKEVLI